MKGPADLAPKLSEQDLALVQSIIDKIETTMGASDAPESYMVIENQFQNAHWRHWTEVKRRCKAAGWEIAPIAGDAFRVVRPELDHPGSVLFERNHPAENTRALVSLIAKAKVTAIVDPYFDNLAADRLLTLSTLGVKFDSNLRILASKRSGASITTYFNDVMTELKVHNATIRIEDSTTHSGRFIFLHSQEVITLGVSLNNFDAHEKPTRTHDKGDNQRFEERWAAAKLIIPGPAKPDTSNSSKLEITFRHTKQPQSRADFQSYRLEVVLKNKSLEHIEGWDFELEFPTPLLGGTNIGIKDHKRSNELRTILLVKDREPLRSEAECPIDFIFTFTDALFRERPDIFAGIARARVSIGNKVVLKQEKPINQLHDFAG